MRSAARGLVTAGRELSRPLVQRQQHVIHRQQHLFRGLSTGPKKYEEELYDDGDGEPDVLGGIGGKAKGGKLRLKEVKTEAQQMQMQRDSDAKDQDAAIRATKIGAGANAILAMGKASIGYSIGSTGLLADGLNHFGDLLCDAVVWYTVIESRKGATADRPWGMGKLEPLGALTVGALLMTTGVGIGYTAAVAAYDMLTLHLAVGGALPSDAVVGGAGPSQEQLQNMALGISFLSIVGKEMLYHYTLAAGKRANSAVVVANAWQHRADAIVSSAVFAGLVGANMGVPLLDPLAGLLVSGVIVKQAVSTSFDALRDLSDAPAPKHETEALVATCLGVPGIKSVETLRARKSGPFLYVECTVGVEGTISASAAHRLAELARKEMMRSHRGRVANAVVDVEPLGSTGLGEKTPLWARDHDAVGREITKALQPIMDPAGITGVSEVQVYYRDDGSLMVKADVRMCADLTIRSAHALALKARLQIEQALPGVGEVDVDLELDEGYNEAAVVRTATATPGTPPPLKGPYAP